MVEAVSERDTGLSIFGAKSHRWTFNAPHPDVGGIEREHGISLPPLYRRYLSELGDGGAGPDHGIQPFGPVARSLPVDPEDLAGAVPERANPARPFAFEGDWTMEDPGPLLLPAGVHPYDGCVRLTDVGCGGAELLAVTGPRAGWVVTDCVPSGGVFGLNQPIETWFTAWLRSCLAEVGLSPSAFGL